jgi:diguanylate cyclase (GGDEF)-like protein
VDETLKAVAPASTGAGQAAPAALTELADGKLVIKEKEHILCVDDEEGILRVLRQQLGRRFGSECEISVAQSASDALELVDELNQSGEPLAVVIADQIMPGMKGVELLEEVNKRSPATNKILLTGQAGLDAVVSAINRAGLNRYIPKPWDEPDLRLTVESLLRAYRLSRENGQLIEHLRDQNAKLEILNNDLERLVRERTQALEEANARLSQLAITDGLTGLYNHRYFHERLALEVERALRTGLSLTMLMIDVDHFKLYNDSQGHPAGDDVLRTVARLLREERRVNDVVARYGGEEFAILLVDVDARPGKRVAERIRDRIAQHPFPHVGDLPGGALTVSIGVASCPEHARSAKDLLSVADAALYKAKQRGRNQVAVASRAA